MPVEFLPEAQVAAFGRFTGPPSRAELERFFFLDDADRVEIAQRRGQHNRLGFAVQLGTVRFLGAFLDDPLDVPTVVVEYLAEQLGIADASVVKAYVERSKTPYEHAWAIGARYGYRRFTEAGIAEQLEEFLTARAWTRMERPSALFDQAVAWLRAEKILLPGAAVLARLVAEVRTEASAALHSLLSTRVHPELAAALDGLLTVAEGARVSPLDRLRQAPTRASGAELVRALDRVWQLTALGVGRLDLTDVPPGRLDALARYGSAADVWSLRRMPAARRTATLVATVQALTASAADDALDVFATLMAERLIAPAGRAAARENSRAAPGLAAASITLADLGRVFLELVSTPQASAEAAWARLVAAVPHGQVAAAVATVAEHIPTGLTDADHGMRAELAKRYATVRPFLPLLGEVLPLRAAPAGEPVLGAVRGLADLVGRKRVRRAEIDEQLLSGSWRRLVLSNPDLPPDIVDHRAWALCVLEHLHGALRRRDVHVTGRSRRWGDPRVRLLSGQAWELTRPQMLTALRLPQTPQTHLAALADRLDAAWFDLAARLPPGGQAQDGLRLQPGPDGRIRLHPQRLEALDEPVSLRTLRETVAAMLPRVDLPEVLLEVHAWTGYLDEFSHLAGTGTRMEELPVSMAAVLIAEGCNLGLSPVLQVASQPGCK